MVLERVKRIAETGEIPMDNPVANIMAQVNLTEQEPQDSSLWGSFKNWAGTRGGRMTLGGLGTALGVGMTGGGLKDALGYGIVGAGNTAKGIYNKEQDRNRLAQEYAKNVMYWQNAEKNRQQQAELWDKRLQAAREDAQLDYERRLAELNSNRDFQRELAHENREYALEDRKANQEFQRAIAEETFKRNKEMLGLNQDFTRENWLNQERRDIASRQFNADLQREGWQNQALQNEIARQASLDWNREQMANANTQSELDRKFKSDLADIAYQRTQDDWLRNQNALLEAEQRENDLYNQRLSDERAYNQQILNDNRKYEDAVRKENAENELAKIYYQNSLKSQPSFNELQAGVNNGTVSADAANRAYGQNVFTDKPSKIDEKEQELDLKARKEQEEAARQNEAMRPRVLQAISRAREALRDGTGLGQIGGWGWTTGQGGINRSDIQSAQAQINTAMRGLLKELGVGSTELNSAAEAVAYRYLISPDMPVQQIERMLDNFEKDYMSGEMKTKFAQDLGLTSGKAPQYSEGTIAEDANGNRLVYRGGVWQAM